MSHRLYEEFTDAHREAIARDLAGLFAEQQTKLSATRIQYEALDALYERLPLGPIVTEEMVVEQGLMQALDQLAETRHAA